MSIIDVVNNQLVFPLFGISNLHHAYKSSDVIKVIEEFMLNLVPTINVLECEVDIPIKGIPLKGLNKLFDQ